MRNKPNLLFLFSAALVVMISLPQAWGQARRGNLRGTVVDSEGNGLVGVTLKASSPTSIQPRIIVTGENGEFTMPALPVGTYMVDAYLTGFKSMLVTNVNVPMGSTATVKITLELDTKLRSVVEGDVSHVLDLSSQTISADITSEEFVKVPPARDPWSVLALVPSIQDSQGKAGGPKQPPKQLRILELPAIALRVDYIFSMPDVALISRFTSHSGFKIADVAPETPLPDNPPPYNPWPPIPISWITSLNFSETNITDRHQGAKTEIYFDPIAICFDPMIHFPLPGELPPGSDPVSRPMASIKVNTSFWSMTDYTSRHLHRFGESEHFVMSFSFKINNGINRLTSFIERSPAMGGRNDEQGFRPRPIIPLPPMPSYYGEGSSLGTKQKGLVFNIQWPTNGAADLDNLNPARNFKFGSRAMYNSDIDENILNSFARNPFLNPWSNRFWRGPIVPDNTSAYMGKTRGPYHPRPIPGW